MQHIYASTEGFVALKTDGTVVAWGRKVPPAVENALALQKVNGKVLSTTSNDEAISALKADGSVLTWGLSNYGRDCSKVQAQLARDVQHIYASDKAFAALKTNSVIAWGDPQSQEEAASEPLGKLQENGVVQSIVRNDWAAAALTMNGSVFTWVGPNEG